MLQEYLNAQLLPITDEEYFGKLQKVAEALAKSSGKNKAKIRSFALVSLDPEINIDNPDVVEVQRLITASWNTFLTNTSDSPLTFIRAVILEALEILSSDPGNASLIWLTTRDVFRFIKVNGKEQEIIKNFILKIGQQVEDITLEEWSSILSGKIQKLSLQLKELTVPAVDNKTLQKLFVWASGPHDEASVVPFKDPNPHWANSGPPWSYAFAPKAATAVSQEVNKTLKEFSKEITSNQNQFQEALNKILIQFESMQQNVAVNLKTQLLWWKEAAYSPSIKSSYKKMRKGVLQVILAVDYSSFVPYAYPASVDFFLEETHNFFSRDKDEKIKLSEILNLINQANIEVKKVLNEPNLETGRMPLINFVQGYIWGKLQMEQFKSHLGFPEDTEISLPEFTTWIFHELEANKIVTSK